MTRLLGRLQARTRLTLYSACILLLGVCGLATQLAAEDIAMVLQSAEQDILRSPGTPSAGSADPDIVLVEYFDYNCSFCKRLNPVLTAFLESDKKAALVYKEWPILSETSKYAAELALASVWQGKYAAAHDVLMRAPHLASHLQIESLLRSAGVDLQALYRDRAAHGAEIRAILQRNDAEAAGVGIRGTPGLLIGRHVVDIGGVYQLAGLKQAVADVRRADAQRSP
jgi:protein-disulfide isomerase